MKYCQNIELDPNKQLRSNDLSLFTNLHDKYDSVFNPRIGVYNDNCGRIRASINMGPVEPPPQKGRLPLYNRKNLDVLQDKFDELENLGVMAKPEDVGVIVEHVSPSFLVKKPSGDYRLVTNFSHIGSYAKPIPC